MPKNYTMNFDTLDLSKYKRINVIGSPGAGKSTIALSISKKLCIPVFDLDCYLYHDKCIRKNRLETIEAIDSILERDTFIIDGTYTTSFEHRLKKVDLIVLVENPSYRCFYNFVKRLLLSKNLKCGEKLTIKTFVLLLTFNLRQKDELLNLVTKYQKTCIKIKI
jgi:adenylate kinase family enzyme